MGGKDPSALILSAVKLCEDAVKESKLDEEHGAVNTIVSESDTGRETKQRWQESKKESSRIFS